MKFKIGDAGFLFASTLLVNAGNYLINLILGRILGPERFAEVSVIATGVLMLSFFAVGIQLTSAKFSAGYYADQELGLMSSFEKWINQKVLWISIAIGALILVCSKLLQGFLHFESWIPIAIIGLGIPLYFNMSIKRGMAQGTDMFTRLAWTYILEMLLRLIVTMVLVFTALHYTIELTTEAVSMGFLFSFFAAVWIQPHYKKQENTEIFDGQKAVLAFVGIIIFYEFSQILINNSDVILVKHFFSAEESGLYAAIALIGRVVFFGTWTIVTLLFPKVIQREKQGLDHMPLFWLSFGITAGFGACVIIACYFIPNLIISILFGEQYLSVSHLLWEYAVATTLFAGANVFAYYYMSLNKYFPVLLSIIAGISQVSIIYFMHESMTQVIHVQIWIMSILLLCMIVYQLYENFKLKKLNPKSLKV